jgi:hypothetical protein
MNRILMLFVVLMLGTGCSRTAPVSKCMTNADRIISEVQEHRVVYGSSGQFGNRNAPVSRGLVRVVSNKYAN